MNIPDIPVSEDKWPGSSGRVPSASSDERVHVPSDLVEQLHKTDGMSRGAFAVIHSVEEGSMAHMVGRIKVLMGVNMMHEYDEGRFVKGCSLPCRPSMQASEVGGSIQPRNQCAGSRKLITGRPSKMSKVGEAKNKPS